MKTPNFTGGVLGLVAVAAVLWVVTQQRDLTGLRAEQKRVLAQLAAEPSESSRSAAPPANNVAETAGSNPELLQLRSEVTRLTQRKRELAAVEKEHDDLSSRLAAHKTGGGLRLLIPGKVRMVGYSTPEDTIESLLWAIQHGDLTNFVQAFDLEVAQGLPIHTLEAWTNAMKDFHQQFTGLSILGRQELPDGRVELTVKLVDREEAEQPLHFKQVNGQWKVQDLK
jgi:hypothetical protein